MDLKGKINLQAFVNPRVMRSILCLALVIFFVAGSILLIALRILQIQSRKSAERIVGNEINFYIDLIESKVLYIQRSLVGLRDDYTTNYYSCNDGFTDRELVSISDSLMKILNQEVSYHEARAAYYHFTGKNMVYHQSVGLKPADFLGENITILGPEQYTAIQPFQVNDFVFDSKTGADTIVSDVMLAMALQYGLDYGYVALEVNGDLLAESLDDARTFPDETVYILNSDRTPIYANGDINRYEAVDWTSLLDGSMTDTPQWITVSGDSHLVFVHRAWYSDWWYVSLVPSSNITALYRSVSFIILPMAIPIILVGVVLAGLLVQTLYRPIQRLYRRISGQPAARSKIDAVDYIGNAYEKMMENNQSLRERMQRNLPLLQEKYMLQLLLASDETQQQIVEHLEQIDIRLPYGRFRVMVISKQQSEPAGDVLGSLKAEFIKEIFNELLCEYGKVHIIQFAPRRYAGLVNYDSMAMPELFSRLSRELTRLREEHHLSLYVGISEQTEQLNRLDGAFMNALQANEQAMLAEHEPIVLHRQTGGFQSVINAVYLFEMEKELLDGIKAANRPLVEERLDQIRRYFRQQQDHTFRIRQMLLYLNNNLRGMMLEIDDGDVFDAYRQSWASDFTEVQSLDSAMDTAARMADIMLDAFRKRRQGHQQRLANQIMDYIGSHYNEALEVEQIAAMAYISVPSLYKLFKESFGESPVHCLNQIRIRHAADMLKDTRLSVKEIASACGFQNEQAFYRQFKKIMHMTAQQYRQRLGLRQQTAE